MKKIVEIAGHGGFGVTPGKRSPDNEYEWHFNDAILRYFNEHLLNNYTGFNLSRIDDPTGKTDISLQTRVNRARLQNPDVVVEFHNNALKGVYGDHGGTEIFTAEGNNPKSEKLAGIILPKLIKELGTKNRGLKKEDFFVLKYLNKTENIPIILIEYFFMDSKKDILKLRNKEYLKKAGIATAEGVAEYLNLPKKVAPQPVKTKPKPIQTFPMKTVYRVFENDKQVGAYEDPLKAISDLLKKGTKNIKIEKI